MVTTLRLAPALEAVGGEQVRAAVPLPATVGEQVPGLHRLRAAGVAEELGLDPADDAAVQELVVHVEEVLVHERVMAGDGARERHRLVPGRAVLRQVGQRRRVRLGRVAREDEHEPVGLLDRVGPHAARRSAGPLGQVRDLRDAAVPPVSPGVVAAAQHVAFHDPHAQRDLAVRAPVLQGVDRAALAAVQGDPLPRERGRERLALTHLGRDRDRIPEVRVDPGAPEVGLGPRLGRRHARLSVRLGLVGLIVNRKRLSHTRSPLCTEYSTVQSDAREH